MRPEDYSGHLPAIKALIEGSVSTNLEAETAEHFAKMEAVAEQLMVFGSDGWPDDATLLAHGRLKNGLAFTDPDGWLERQRDMQEAGFDYHAPSERDIEAARKWDRYYQIRAERNEITGSLLDEEVKIRLAAAKIVASGALKAKRSGRANLRAAFAYRPTRWALICLLTATIYSAAMILIPLVIK